MKPENKPSETEKRTEAFLKRFLNEGSDLENFRAPTLDEKAEAMDRLREHPDYKVLVLDRWSELIRLFSEFCQVQRDTDRSTLEILNLHSMAHALYLELHRPDQIMVKFKKEREKRRKP